MKNPPDGWPRIAPVVFYNDAAAAIDWLSRAFGFAVREKVENDGGQIFHSQFVLDGGLIMVKQVGLHPDRTYPQSPLAVGGANTQSLALYVDDMPVTERSEKGCVVITRQACNKRLREAVYHWARVAIQHDAASRPRYDELPACSKRNARAMRTVSDRLLKVICAMLRNRTPYDPEHRAAGSAAA